MDAIEGKVKLLAEADPAAKAALYASLGVKLTYHPDRQTVLVEAQPTEIWATERVGEPTCTIRTKTHWRLRPWPTLVTSP